jgi:hypothetical protein
MKHRKLRIAWSLAWGIVAILLVALWARSYWHYDWLGGLSIVPTTNGQLITTGGCLFESATGAIVVVFKGDWRESLENLRSFGTSSPEPNLRVTGNEGESACSGFRFKRYSASTYRAAIPHWFGILIAGIAALIVWLPWRFSVRTLLVVTTFVAIGLGLLVWAIR